MLYTQHNIGDLDLSKYQRFVALGCSFTRWYWPTWSDLLAQEMPDAKFTNLARGGAGNQYIVTMLNLLQRKYKFGPETLVGICWSTFCREDRYVLENSEAIRASNYGWHTPGNLINAPDHRFWPRDFLNKLEIYHYLIRDASTISTASGYLKTTDFDSINIMGMDIRQQIPYGLGGHREMDKTDSVDGLIMETIDLYDDLDDLFLGYLKRDHTEWPGNHVYPKPGDDAYVDYHPRSIDYADYLETWGIPLSAETKAFAQDATDQINAQTDPNWMLEWPWQCTPSVSDHKGLDPFFKNHF